MQRPPVPVEHRAVLTVTGGVHQRSQAQHAAAVSGQYIGGFDVKNAVESVTLVYRAGVIAGLPAQHGDKVGQQAAGLGKSDANRVAAINQPPTT